MTDLGLILKSSILKITLKSVLLKRTESQQYIFMLFFNENLEF